MSGYKPSSLGMEAITDFSLETLPPPPGRDHSQRSTILWQGQSIGLEIDGVILEGQYAHGSGYLLLVTCDCPFEEAVHAYWLDEAFQCRDTLRIGAMYTPGIVTDLQICGEDVVQFSFWGKDLWQIQAINPPRWWPSLDRPARFFFKKHFLKICYSEVEYNDTRFWRKGKTIVRKHGVKVLGTIN